MAGPPHETRCSAVSAGLGEPLAGNAFTDSRLLCVEHLGPWPRSVDRHPDPALAALVARARTAGRRTRLIRRPGRRPGPDSGRTLLLADTAPGRMRVGALRVRGPGELADVPLDHAGAGAPVDAPMLLVCTHGTGPLLRGRGPLARRVRPGHGARGPGRRPLGVQPSRRAPVRADRAGPAHRLPLRPARRGHRRRPRKAAGQGEVETAHCHGRIAWEPAGQVAELRIREAEGLRAGLARVAPLVATGVRALA
ncbi:MAG: hypothetical protein QOJ30_6421 [Pseudonocardiales bacterium]|nr:hypothetical protein [Pseudonocardiales bacterium]